MQPRVQTQGGFGDQRQCSFGADDQLREVVATRVLHVPTARTNDLAGARDCFDTQHLVGA